MLIKVDKKEDIVRRAIEFWLRDNSVYCNWCGENFGVIDPKYISETPCCENPQVGRNIDHCRAIIKQNKVLRDTRLNEFGSNKSKDLRFAISLPPMLLRFLDDFFRQYTEDHMGIFKEDGEVAWFAKKFPQFTIPERV